MAEEAAELVLEGFDKITDKHFERIWDKTAEISKKRRGKKDGRSETDDPRRRSSGRDYDDPRASDPPLGSSRRSQEGELRQTSSRDSRNYDRRPDDRRDSDRRRDDRRDSDRRNGSIDRDPGERRTPRAGTNDYIPRDASRRSADYGSGRYEPRRYSSVDRDPKYRSSPPRRSSSLRSSRDYERDKARRAQRSSRDAHMDDYNRYLDGKDSDRDPYDHDLTKQSSKASSRDDSRYPPPTYSQDVDRRRRGY